MVSATEDLLAIPDKRAAKLAGISMAQLRYWEFRGVVVPGIRRRLSVRRTIRLYEYQDLVELLVAATLRKGRNITLQHMRQVMDHLRNQGYDAPLRQLRFATHGKEIYFQHPDGTWEGGKVPNQTVLEWVIKLELIRASILKAGERDPDCHGKIVKVRGVHASAPIVAGTRIRVSTVRNFIAAGYDTDAIIAEYPDLTAEDIEAARRYAAAS
ncbi:DUF433 domain-containing protein [Nonomuraea sp. NPDC026600]|uniref:DUF433 domain-containing protein n=1 Tax=Nonomuraea sp. NPDC026600 TaxID=3155363 RepID=UPI003400EB4B